mmetsp:Transcript_14958/g.2159  ORF Transcript_14958/g.2159 Transcript_14958/m.2159 type:complete len:87 (+) Transcript_14958:215-475(+)
MTGNLIHTFTGCDNWVKGIAFHLYLPYMYSISDDKKLRVWSTKTGKVVKKIDSHAGFVSSIDISNNFTQIVTGGMDNKVKVWDLKL